MAFHQYNKTQYNAAQYNADAFYWVVKPTESIASADSRIDRPTKVLTETVTNTDARIVALARAFADFLFIGDVVAKSVLNKGFSESVRTNDWVEVERKSQNNGNGWSN